LEVIYVVRHGFRNHYAVNFETGQYSASIRSPTGIPSDPALAGKGEQQARELADHLASIDPPIDRFYSSPFYRCLQTIDPAVEKISALRLDPETSKIRGENGIGEWYGTAHFEHPSPAPPTRLNELFPRYDLNYEVCARPSANGETIDELHDRTAYALHKMVERSDKEGVKAIIICTHAATMIAIGRTLIGRMPEDIEEVDFRTFTCGLTTFVRRSRPIDKEAPVKSWEGPGRPIPKVDWRDGRGVSGGWECKTNSDCSFLSDGEERGWNFSGDESFGFPPEPNAALGNTLHGQGSTVESKNGKDRVLSNNGSRL